MTLASPSAERRPAWSPWRETWRRYRRHKLAVVSAVLLIVLIVAVAFGPFVWRVSINDIDFNARLEGPSLAHPFGTDDLGQDILARMIYGGRISLAVGLAVFAVDGWTVAAANRADLARAEVGANEVLHVHASSPGALLSAVDAADPSGTQAMAATASGMVAKAVE